MTDVAFAPLPIPGSSGAAFAGQGVYGGIAVRASGGAVDIDVFDSATGTGSPTLMDTIHVATGSTGYTHYAGGIAFKAGVYLSITGAGTPTGSVRIG